MSKVKVATAWLDSCSGCHMSFLDIDYEIANLASVLEFHASPITDIKEFTPVDVGILEGSISNDHDEAVARNLRANCKILVVLGDCACFGGINAMRNLCDTNEVLARYYSTESTVREGKIPGSEELPKLTQVRPVDEVVKVDCFVPGCPPSASTILFVFKELLQGRIPVIPAEMMRFD